MWKRVKNGVQGRVVRFRVPGGPEPAEAGSDERPMPIAASILWKPIEGAAEPDAGLFPVFITQRALAAVHDHCAATTAACFGLLIGDVVDSPETGASHVVVESTIRLPASPDDDAKTVLVQGWVVAQDVLRKSGDLLVGWYRGGGGEAALCASASAGDSAASPPPPRYQPTSRSPDFRNTSCATTHPCTNTVLASSSGLAGRRMVDSTTTCGAPASGESTTSPINSPKHAAGVATQ